MLFLQSHVKPTTDIQVQQRGFQKLKPGLFLKLLKYQVFDAYNKRRLIKR